MGKEVLSATIIGVPLVNEITSDGVITALELEQYVVGGMTVGAIFKLLMLVALVLLVVERTFSVVQKYRALRKEEKEC